MADVKITREVKFDITDIVVLLGRDARARVGVPEDGGGREFLWSWCDDKGQPVKLHTITVLMVESKPTR